MSSKNSELDWTFTASWPLNSMDSRLTSLSQLNVELGSSLNLAADMEQAARRLYEQREQGLMVRLYISRTAKGYRRVIYMEEDTPSSSPSGSEPDKYSGPFYPATRCSGCL